MPLYAHQQRFLAHNPRKALLAWSVGTGKTRAAIEWALKKDVGTLVVCPKGLVQQWKDQVEPHHFTVISKEDFKRKAPGNCSALIIDEADHFFSAHFKSALSKYLRAYIKRYDPALLLLTGTPYRSSPWNIYTAATLLGLSWNYRDFEHAFFTQFKMGMRLISKPKTDPRSTAKLKDLIHKIADVVSLEDCADIPPQLDLIEHLGLTPEQLTAQKNNPEVVPIARFTADHRIEALGYKLERIQRIIDEQRKVVIVCRYLEQMNVLQEHLKKSFNVIRIDGSTQNRHILIRLFEDISEGAILIQADLCEGYELPSCSTMVFASMSFSYRNYVQMKGRILRLNHLHKNTYIHLIAGPADRAILKAIEKGQDFDVTHYSS